MDLTGGFKKTIILSVEPKLYSDLKVIASSEQKTIEDMLQDWIQHLVETRGQYSIY
jgi:DNA-directed RNA polymerase subunit F